MTEEMRALEALAAQVDALSGHLGFYYRNLTTGLEYGLREEEPFLAASVIKLPVYLHLLHLVAEGQLHMDQVLTVTEGEKVPGCGALRLMTGDIRIDLAALCRLMICLSDNTATNALIRLLGIDGCNAGFQAMGLAATVLRRLLFDAEAAGRGLENTISPKEMGTLLEGLFRGTLLPEPLCRQALDTLLDQQICHKLEGKLPEQVAVAHKTGEDSGLSNDVGIVFAAQPFVLCFAGHDTDVYLWEDLMRRSAYDLWQALEPKNK